MSKGVVKLVDRSVQAISRSEVIPEDRGDKKVSEFFGGRTIQD